MPAWLDIGRSDKSDPSRSSAVDAAARNPNSRLRAKVGRKDIGEGDLVAQVFSDKSGNENNPRLRLPLPDEIGDKTRSSLCGGIIADRAAVLRS